MGAFCLVAGEGEGFDELLRFAGLTLEAGIARRRLAQRAAQMPGTRQAAAAQDRLQGSQFVP
jgi:hypothetical protein